MNSDGARELAVAANRRKDRAVQIGLEVDAAAGSIGKSHVYGEALDMTDGDDLGQVNIC